MRLTLLATVITASFGVTASAATLDITFSGTLGSQAYGTPADIGGVVDTFTYTMSIDVDAAPTASGANFSDWRYFQDPSAPVTSTLTLSGGGTDLLTVVFDGNRTPTNPGARNYFTAQSDVGGDVLRFEALDDNPQASLPGTFIDFGMGYADTTGTMLDAALPGGISLADLGNPAVFDGSDINAFLPGDFRILARDDNTGGFRWGFNSNDITGLTVPTFQLSVIPLPAPIAMAGVGLIGVILQRRRFTLTAD